MPQYVVEGGHTLSGTICVSGAKNAASKIIAAALLSDELCTITNVPAIEDIGHMLNIIEDIGATVTRSPGQIIINPATVKHSTPQAELIRKSRSSVMLAGPLLARFGTVTLAHPGGCIIGQRPIDLFLSGFQAMGATIKESEESYTLSAKKLHGARIVMPFIAVTATESLMMTACLAEGTTTIVNAAMEPEIPALAEYLNHCGAKITGAGTPVITVEGVKKLGGGRYKLIPDRIETGSFVIMGLLTQSKITVTNCNPTHIETILEVLRRAGAQLEVGEDYITTKLSQLKGMSIRTHEYPGFPTDLQAPFTVLMTQAQGQSLIHEIIFEGRLFYTDKLVQMGAKIVMCDPHRVLVSGPTQLHGRKLDSPDLRAGMALVLAGLVAKGQTTIDHIHQIERGYEDIIGRLSALGAVIKKIEN
jgi:UDP-N-acetylglucosamine 1-carboxyvinyltransferase